MHNETSGPELKILFDRFGDGRVGWHNEQLGFQIGARRKSSPSISMGNKVVVVRTPFGLPFCLDWCLMAVC